MLKSKRHLKQNPNSNTTIKDTTIDSLENSYNIISNKNKNSKQDIQQIGTICSIDSRYEKYKNLENPFTIPDIPKNAADERRRRILKRINEERTNYKSKSVDNTLYKNNLKKKRNSHLQNKLFVDIY